MATVTEAPIPATLDEEEAPPAGDVLYEVVDGKIVEIPGMGADEVCLASFLLEILGSFTRGHRLGIVVSEALFTLDPVRKLRRRPDLAFVSAEKWPIGPRGPRRAAFPFAADLAIEVISEGNSAEDVLAKVREYLVAGARLVWAIFPVAEQVYVYSSPTSVRVLTRADSLDGGDVVLGFALPLADFFGETAPEPVS